MLRLSARAIIAQALKKTYQLLKHLDHLNSRPGDIGKARQTAKRIADYLKLNYHAEVFGVGSLFLSGRDFTEKSDIDLVVKGLPAGKYFSILNSVNNMSDINVEIIPSIEKEVYILRAKGSIFHDFYSAAERIFCASRFEISLCRGTASIKPVFEFVQSE